MNTTSVSAYPEGLLDIPAESYSPFPSSTERRIVQIVGPALREAAEELAAEMAAELEAAALA